jgi:phosphate transport system substrate-binding protein
MRNLGLIFLGCAMVLTACGSPASAQSSSSGDQETIEDIGSDTIVNLALAWAEAYQTINPDLRISVSGGGTGTGLAALINKTTDIANASRKIKDEEIQNARENGVEPYEIEIARDAIGVIVNPETLCSG